jgi:hypothetical protein
MNLIVDAYIDIGFICGQILVGVTNPNGASHQD